VLALREENALMSYGFSALKSLCGVSAVIGSSFLFADMILLPLSAGRMSDRPTNLRIEYLHNLFPYGLVEVEKALNS